MSIERSRDYMNARRVAKELEVQIRGINRNAPSIPPSATPEERKQVHIDWINNIFLWKVLYLQVQCFNIFSTLEFMKDNSTFLTTDSVLC